MITTTSVYNDVPSVYITISDPDHDVYSVDIPAGEIGQKTFMILVIRIDKIAASTVDLNECIAVLTVNRPPAYYRTYAISLPASFIQFGDTIPSCDSSTILVVNIKSEFDTEASGAQKLSGFHATAEPSVLLKKVLRDQDRLPGQPPSLPPSPFTRKPLKYRGYKVVPKHLYDQPRPWQLEHMAYILGKENKHPLDDEEAFESHKRIKSESEF